MPNYGKCHVCGEQINTAIHFCPVEFEDDEFPVKDRKKEKEKEKNDKQLPR